MTTNPNIALREQIARDHAEILPAWDALQLGGPEEMVIRLDRERQAGIKRCERDVAAAMRLVAQMFRDMAVVEDVQEYAPPAGVYLPPG